MFTSIKFEIQLSIWEYKWFMIFMIYEISRINGRAIIRYYYVNNIISIVQKSYHNTLFRIFNRLEAISIIQISRANTTINKYRSNRIIHIKPF